MGSHSNTRWLWGLFRQYGDSSITQLVLFGQLAQAAQQGGGEGGLWPKIAKKFLGMNDVNNILKTASRDMRLA